MALLVVPTSTELSSYTQRVTLDGREYFMSFQWNQREAKWYLAIADENEDTIVSGIKVVADFPLTRKVADTRIAPGELLAIDFSQTGQDPGLTDFGERVLLVYVEASDVEATPAVKIAVI